MKDKDPFDRFSARIKNLYIELNEYAYFHSPSEIGRIDRRFTGRKRVLERLKSLFTDYETPSGAYLVTGYRGAGKSSLVAKALSEVSPGSGPLRRSSRLLRLFLPILPLSLLGGLFGAVWMWSLLGMIWFLLLLYLLWTDPRFPDLLEGSRHSERYLLRFFEILNRLSPFYPKGSGESEPRFRSILRFERLPSLWRCFFLGVETSPRERFRLLGQDFFILCGLILTTEVTLWFLATDPMSVWLRFAGRLFAYVSCLGVFLIVNWILAIIVEHGDSEDLELSRPLFCSLGEFGELAVLFGAIELGLLFLAPFPWFWIPLPVFGFFLFIAGLGWMLVARSSQPPSQRSLPFYEARPREVFVMILPGLMVLRLLWKQFKDHMRYSSRVFIKINLSQDDIREIDILRLIAKNVHLKYRQFNRSWRTDFHWKVVRVFLLLLIVGLIYNLETVVGLNCGIKNDLHVSCYFPSQGEFFLKGGVATYHTAVGELSKERRFGAEALRAHLAEKEPSEYSRKYLAGLADGLSTSDGPPVPEALLPELPLPSDLGLHSPFKHKFRRNLAGRVQQVTMGLANYLDTFVQRLYRRGYDAIPSPLQEIRLGSNSPPDEAALGLGKTSDGSTDTAGREVAAAETSNQNEVGLFSLLGLRQSIPLVPPSIDYLFLIYVGGVWLVLGLFLRWPSGGFVSHRAILKRLEELNEMIESRVTREKGILPAPTGALFAINFGRRESRTSPNLTERDIEKHLLEILSMIEGLPRLTVRPEFVIVFDELDKIQHLKNYTLSEREEQQNEDFRGREFASTEAERERQHKILWLVSNLKHFLTTAPVKFIFIAGREMFDAALADISDRHFFMGSVFNEVLHVPSFHSDESDGRLPDITSLTEQYLCRFLLPRPWWKWGLNLRTYRGYLSTCLWPCREAEDRLAESECEKLIYELHNFITYLTYRSNGAPKKITRTMERFLVRLDREPVDDPDTLCFGRSSRSLYLRFSYYDQYTFGLVTYLGGPLIFSLNRAIKDYGDKILVSSSFLLDHVYKFHGEGFSWRNLELLPEIVDINRAPQLRELITNIMRFLAKSDISEIVSGLYDFKFTRRITEEIAFLSKISEEESAAFNFTLDESLAIKRHFNRKLNKLLDTYKDYPNAGQEKFVNSIAFVRMILGDLHFYDGELDSAIIEYMEAVQALRNLDTENIRIDTLVLMVRNFLKLGLAFERKKSYESAFVTYGRISAMLTQIGERSRQKDCRWQIPITQGKLHRAEQIFSQTAFEGIRLIYQPMFARLQLIEKSTLGGITQRDVDNVIEEFREMLSPRQAKERFLIEGEFKNKLADILYFKNGPLPGSEEKVYCHRSEGALCSKNINWKALAIKERRRLPCSACVHYHDALSGLCQSFLGIEVEKLGAAPWPRILGSLEQGREMAERQNSLKELGGTLSDLGDTFLSCSKDREIDEKYLVDLLGLLGEHKIRLRATRLAVALGFSGEDGAHPSAVELLASLSRSQTETLAEILGSPRAQRLDETGRGELEKELQERVKLRNTKLLEALAGLSSVERPKIAKIVRQLRPRSSEELASALTRLDGRRGASQGLNKLEEALTCYVIAILLFQWAGNSRASGRELSKILWVFRELIAVGGRGIGRALMDQVVEALVPGTIRQNYLSHEGTHRLEIEQIKEVLETEEVPRPFIESVNLGRLSIGTSVIESLAVADEIELELGSRDEVVPLDRRCSPHAMFHSVFARIHSLRYRSRVHFHNLRVLGVLRSDDRRRFSQLPDKARALAMFDGDSTIAQEVRGGQEILEFMIADSIYCCHEIIRFLAIYGTSYMASHSMRAAAHRNLSLWCDLYYNYLRDYKKLTSIPDRMPAVRRLEKQLRRMVGEADMVDLSPNFHAEMALRHLESAKQAHSEGKAYSELIEGMYYLTDDFADQLEHFCAGLERFLINSGAVDRGIQQLRHRLATTAIYKANRYQDAGWSAGKRPREEPPQSQEEV